MIGRPHHAMGADGRQWMQVVNDRSKSNIRLALILGLIAFGFFLLGLYLATGREV